MFGIKTAIQKKIFRAYGLSDPVRFPTKRTPLLLVQSYLLEIKKQLSKRHSQNSLGWLFTPPNSAAVKAYGAFLYNNPNNLGTWSHKERGLWHTQRLEHDSIHALIHLYHANHKTIEGYMTAGGTEGNLYAAWAGNTYLRQYCKLSQICLLRTSLTHYSLRKAASITNVRDFVAPLSSQTWGVDPKSLVNTIVKLYKQGYRGFLIPLTVGYTNTGTSDDVTAVLAAVKSIRRTYKDFRHFLWIDAALDGLVRPFTEKTFYPLRSPHVQACIVDFHKFGGVPYPAGIILYRKKLRKLVEEPIDYLDRSDATVSGSRPGAPAAAIWATIHALGKNGFKALAQTQLDNKKYCISEIQRILPGTEIVTGPNSLSCGLIFRSVPNQTIAPYITQKYGLFAKPISLLFSSGIRKVRLYKLYFLPHVTKGAIQSFIFDLEKLYKDRI